jgi:octaprenyl-diphosphate synthase
MELKSIYQPIRDELIEVDRALKNSLKNTKRKSILRINNYLLDAEGKRLRPALVLLSAKATSQHSSFNRSLIKVAAALEIIHTVSLIHDDVIDHANIRHNKPTINSKFGEDVSIALGDYLYSVAFELISNCGNSDIIRCISSATKAMCKGELLQVCERDNLSLSRQKYFLIVKKKTASLFSASCEVGSQFFSTDKSLIKALREYGLNFGIAFQIIDDYLDLIGEKNNLGKVPGQDIKTGEITLPIINLWESLSQEGKKDLQILLGLRRDRDALKKINRIFFEVGANNKTKESALYFINLAKEKIENIPSSCYKDSLINLADFIVKR